MQIYSEFVEGDRKATVTRLKRSEWNRDVFDVWEVAMFIQGKPIQRATVRTESEADLVAEDFVKGYSSGLTLLNEHVSNG